VTIHAELARTPFGDNVAIFQLHIGNAANLVFVFSTVGIMAGGTDDGFILETPVILLNTIHPFDESNSTVAAGAGTATFRTRRVARGDRVSGKVPLDILGVVGFLIVALATIALS
jgi:hypothetical protein